MFDFSQVTRAEAPSLGRVFLVGDALLEPFWPEGLGPAWGGLSSARGCMVLPLLPSVSHTFINDSSAARPCS